MVATCPSDNTQAEDQEGFWSADGIHWDAHRIGWAISGGCAVVTVIITVFSVLSHCRNYTVPAEQRQIIRILYMPPVYAIISFFSYRFFRSYTYYELIEVVYEAVTLSAFMLLIIEYVAATASDHSAKNALERKDKRKLPIPLCCWRYRPTKAYFLYTMKWLVMQYVVIRPLVSIAGIIGQAYNVLCEQEGLTHFEYAYPYLSIVDFISISLSLYGLFVFYGLTKDELKGQRPLAKFWCIKLIVMFTFYQSFVFELLEGRVIHATAYWTETNIANGLNALAICIEMVFFALAMLWAYPSFPYKKGDRTKIGRPLLDSINYSDFAADIYSSLKFFIDYFRGKPGTHTPKNKPNLAQAFGVEGAQPFVYTSAHPYPVRNEDRSSSGYFSVPPASAALEANKAGVGAGLGRLRGTGMGAGLNADDRLSDQARAGDGSTSIEQYGDSENIRLTAYPPQNGMMTATTFASANASSEDTHVVERTYGAYGSAQDPPPWHYAKGQY